MDKLSATINADLRCLSKTDREEVLNQVGISIDGNFDQDLKVESFSSIWSIELLIISKLKRADLVARLWAIRQKFRSQVGEDVYRYYVSSLADELTEEKIKLLIAREFEVSAPITAADKQSSTSSIDGIKLEEAIRGDIINITRQTQRLSYYKLLRLESIYKVKGTILSVLFTVLVLMASSLFLLFDNTFSIGKENPEHYSLAMLTIFSGMIGACLSLLQRTEKASGAPSSFTDSVLDAMDIKLSMSIWYVLSLIISGAIFATILYLLAVSGTFNLGGLLPTLVLQQDSSLCQKPSGIDALFGCIKFDKTNSLMLVWAFMAGFAERLVPDTLDALVEKSRKSKS